MVLFGQGVLKIFASFDSKRTLLLFYIILNFDLGIFSFPTKKIYKFVGQYIPLSIPFKILYLLIFNSSNLVNALRRYSQVSLYSVRNYIDYILYTTTWSYFQSIRRKYSSFTDILYIVRFLSQLSTILYLFRGIWPRNNGFTNKFRFFAIDLFTWRYTSCYG